MITPWPPASSVSFGPSPAGAVISPTSFSNYYTFGDLKADPRELLTRYFDASMYFANWMFVDLAFRYAKHAIDVASIRRYRAGQSFDIRVKGQTSSSPFPQSGTISMLTTMGADGSHRSCRYGLPFRVDQAFWRA